MFQAFTVVQCYTNLVLGDGTCRFHDQHFRTLTFPIFKAKCQHPAADASLHSRSALFGMATDTGLFISPSGTSKLDCATTKTDTIERSISIGRESLKVFFLY